MASLNTAARELVFKIVYYGPGLGGKTTSLQALHEATPAERRGKLVSLATPVDRTLFFDFLPIRLAAVRGLSIRLQLFTVPGQVYFNATRRLVLSGSDGIVFVADSQRDRMDANCESLENLRENLAEHGRDLAAMPHVFAYNKRDLPDVVTFSELQATLNRHQVAAFPTVAIRSEGVRETLDAITEAIQNAYHAQLPESRENTSSDRLNALPNDAKAASRVHRDGESPAAEALRHTRRSLGSTPVQFGRPPTTETKILPLEASAQRASLERGGFASIASSSVAAPNAGRDSTSESVDGDDDSRSALDELDSDVSSEDIESEPPREDHTRAPEEPDPTAGLTFGPLFAPAERPLVEQIEASINHGAYADALGMCDAALNRLLSAVAMIVQGDLQAPNPNDPANALLLGLDGRRYLTFRALVRRARHVGDVGLRDVLEAYTFLLDARVAATQWEAIRVGMGATSNPPPSRPAAPQPPSGLPPLPRVGGN